MKQIKDQIDNKDIPDYVTHVTKKLEEAGFEAFLVGGCVRDLLMGRVPKDWDITTNAKPEDIMQVFEKTIYENSFGTVAVCLRKEDFVTQETIKGVDDSISHETKSGLMDMVTQETEYYILEVTPYRTEGKYTDFRHPDEVVFSDNIEDDLKRRDFTINAMSYSISKGHIKDIYKGHKDIKDMLIKAVGNPETRFNEDALRMLRAVRFSCQLGFTISQETAEAIFKKSDLLKNISAERIRDEFTKIIETDKGVEGIILMHQLGLLPYVIPEILPCLGCEQGGAHIYDVFGHSLEALSHAISMGWSLEIRLAALLHDIGKPKSRRINKKGSKAYTFYGHEVVGAKIAQNILERLKYPKKTTDLVVSLIKNHMFFSDTETITFSAVRRIIQKVGQDHIWDLMKVRECDRAGMKKAEAPYRLRKYHAMIEEVLRDPISVSQLAIDGSYLIKELKIEPGPRMGFILNALLEEVLEDPTKNTKEILSSFVFKLNLLSDEELKRLGDRGKEKKEKLEKEEIAKLHIKHKIKP